MRAFIRPADLFLSLWPGRGHVPPHAVFSSQGLSSEYCAVEIFQFKKRRRRFTEKTLLFRSFDAGVHSGGRQSVWLLGSPVCQFRNRYIFECNDEDVSPGTRSVRRKPKGDAMHILQHHIFSLPPPIGGSDEGRLLCCRGRFQKRQRGILFDTPVRWDTLFNLFPLQDYARTGNVRELRLLATLCGRGRVLVKGLRRDGKEVLLRERCFDCPSPISLLCMPSFDSACVYCFMEIVPEQRSVTLYNAAWGTNCPALRHPSVALIICTYRREEQLRENLKQIFRYAGRHPAFIDVLVVDNDGGLAPADIFPSGRPTSENSAALFTNPCNLGGAGGFARGMHEAIKRKKYTHILLMDDDISLHPEMLHRLVQLLRHAECPETLAVSGIVLDREYPSRVVEWGGRYPGHPVAIAAGRDISRPEELMPPSQAAEYGAWTFFCYPLTRETAKELPLPLFVRGDDAEFGLRLGTQHGVRIVTPSSLAVWHHAFTENSPLALYHTLRNELIINELYKKFTFRILARYISIPFYYLVKNKPEKARIAVAAFQAFISGSGELLSVEYEDEYTSYIKRNIILSQCGAAEFFIKYIKCSCAMILYYISRLKIYNMIVKSSRLVWTKYFLCTDSILKCKNGNSDER